MKEYEFDVAFSYAGEQRNYVDKLYNSLISRGISVFYDGGQLAKLWGKDLYQYLSDVYQHKAKYCILFLSKEYAGKLWTKHELKVAQARAFKEAGEYILPIRFDQTEIPGILSTVSYIDVINYNLEEISDLIFEKIKDSGHIGSILKKTSSSQLEIALSDALIWAEEYLKPQPLVLSDKIAQAVRSSFSNSRIIPSVQSIKLYILSEEATYRVVGYLAYLIQPFTNDEIILDFLGSLSKERKEASENKETRPLWQLLLCIEDLMKITDDNSITLQSLQSFLEFMENDTSIDIGGECKDRIRFLLKNYL